jgi:hypothetical protein
VPDRYAKAQRIKEEQDKFCSEVLNGNWQLGQFPEELQWEALVDVLRGRVKVSSNTFNVRSYMSINSQVHTHCYEAVDMDDFVRVRDFLAFPDFASFICSCSFPMNSSSLSLLFITLARLTLFLMFSKEHMVRVP